MTNDTYIQSNDTYIQYVCMRDMPYIPYKAKVLCTDGRIRTARRLAESPNTYFSLPATVTAYGKTVTGYISSDEDPAGKVWYTFTAYSYRKNGSVLPGITIAPGNEWRGEA
jgi:hypothetical protein